MTIDSFGSSDGFSLFISVQYETHIVAIDIMIAK